MKLKHWSTTLFVALMYMALPGFAQTIATPSLPVKVVSQSPADTATDLQIICLFRSSPVNTLHGALIETDEKLKGTIQAMRGPALFKGELGETVLLTPPAGTLAAKRLLIIGLGDSQTFTPERMRTVGEIAFMEADRLGISHPSFAPTVIDGGVTKFTTAQVSYQVVLGFLDALATERLLESKGAAGGSKVTDFIYLAGVKYAAITQSGVDKALSKTRTPVEEGQRSSHETKHFHDEDTRALPGCMPLLLRCFRSNPRAFFTSLTPRGKACHQDSALR